MMTPETAIATRIPITLTVVLPVFNNADCLQELLQRLSAILGQTGLKDYEIICVDDGSGDNSRDVIKSVRESDSRVKLIQLTRNFGHQFAITAGFDLSKGDAVLVMDADLQDPPEAIPEFLQKWREGYDIVYGVRLERAGESRFKRLTASMFYRILRKLTKTEIALDSGDFRLLSRRAMDSFNQLRERARFVRGMVGWLGYPQAPVYYKRAPRWAGKSQYSISRLVRLAFDAVVSFSDVPLRIATWLGFLGVSVCITYFGYIMIANAVWGVPVQGWASLVVIVLFIGCVQLTILGMIGQYIGRIYDELKGRPLYIIGDLVGFNAAKDNLDD
jgi:glycosyltransferase involved in cell wall biosynthesis